MTYWLWGEQSTAVLLLPQRQMLFAEKSPTSDLLLVSKGIKGKPWFEPWRYNCLLESSGVWTLDLMVVWSAVYRCATRNAYLATVAYCRIISYCCQWRKEINLGWNHGGTTGCSNLISFNSNGEPLDKVKERNRTENRDVVEVAKSYQAGFQVENFLQNISWNPLCVAESPDCPVIWFQRLENKFEFLLPQRGCSVRRASFNGPSLVQLYWHGFECWCCGIE